MNSERQIVTIGIPVYKSTPTDFELFSLVRCCKVLGKYPFSIITDHKTDIQIYLQQLEEHHVSYKIKYFDREYFTDINGYNKLMVSAMFYKMFSRFEYLLIYQLDALVFSDKLTEWCAKGFDYVGAPWLNVKWVNKKQINKKLPFFAAFPFLFRLLKGKDGLTGNGGFSLRKIDAHIKYAAKYGATFPSLNFNEDLFWGKYVAAKERSFAIPLLKEALSFAIESDPETGFAIIKNQLPFGCHAWYKKDQRGWDIIFEKAGISTSQFFNRES